MESGNAHDSNRAGRLDHSATHLMRSMPESSGGHYTRSLKKNGTAAARQRRSNCQYTIFVHCSPRRT